MQLMDIGKCLSIIMRAPICLLLPPFLDATNVNSLCQQNVSIGNFQIIESIDDAVNSQDDIIIWGDTKEIHDART